MRILLLCLFVGPLFSAAPPATFTASQASSAVEIKPQSVPTTTTVVAATDVHLLGAHITVPAGVTITFVDNQGTPIPVVPIAAPTVQTVYVVSWPFGYWCPGGITISASGSGATYYLTWR